jgi:hypothetical protein
MKRYRVFSRSRQIQNSLLVIPIPLAANSDTFRRKLSTCRRFMLQVDYIQLAMSVEVDRLTVRQPFKRRWKPAESRLCSTLVSAE